MAETLKDFFAGVGFKLDEVSQTQSENAVKRTEERNTAKVKAETRKREAAEKAALAARDKARRDADQKQAARMKASLKNAQGFALRFSGVQAAIAMATSLTAIGISEAVSKAAAGFERLAYLGRLSDASPANVTAFGYAAEQTGSSRQEADAALTAFGRKLHIARTGYAKYLEQMGVQTRDAAGNFRDSAEILTDLGDKMRTTRDTKEFGYANAIGVGQSLGLPEFLSRAVMDPAFRQREAEQKAIQSRAGSDPNAAAAGGTAYMQSLRHLDEVIKAVETRVETVLFVKLKPFLDKLADWFLANGDRIANIVSKIADDLIRLAVAIGEKLAAADWDQVLKHVEDLAKRLAELVGPLTGDKSLIVLIGALGLALAGLSAVIMPRWLLLLLGVGVIASLGVGKAEAADTGEARARDEGGGGGRAGLGARIARGVRKLTGVDTLRARGREATDARHAEANAPSRPLSADMSGQKIVGGANLMSGGQYPGAQPGANLTTIKLKDGRRLTVHADAAPSFQRFFNQLIDQGYDIKSIAGYSPRANRSNGARLSEHAYGNAVDVNPFGLGNGFHDNRTDLPANVSKLAAENGLSWGGDWRNRDNMHFEWRGVRPWEKKDSPTPTIGERPTSEDLMRAQNEAYRSPQNPFLHSKPKTDTPVRPLGDTPAIHQSMLYNMGGDTNLTSGGVYKVKGGDAKSNLAAARVMADQAHRDLIRRAEGANIG